MVSIMAVPRRCPRHNEVLVWDANIGLWRCPQPGCYYMMPGDPPVEPETEPERESEE